VHSSESELALDRNEVRYAGAGGSVSGASDLLIKEILCRLISAGAQINLSAVCIALVTDSSVHRVVLK